MTAPQSGPRVPDSVIADRITEIITNILREDGEMEQENEQVTGDEQYPEVVYVPEDRGMAYEPARVIAKAMEAKNAIVIILSVMGIILGPVVLEQIDILIQSAGVIWTAGYTIWAAHRQGELTREAVYSPASAAVTAASNRSTVLIGEPRDAVT